MRLGINRAIKLINEINLNEIYDERKRDIKTISEIPNFNYEWLLDYIANLEVPYNVVRDFFNGDIVFADLNNNIYDDDWDYLCIDRNGEIYCWTEIAGNIYYLKDYGRKWIEYNEPPLSEEDKLKEEIRRKEFEKLFAEQLKKMYDEVLPKLVADENVEVKPMGDFRKFAMDVINKEEDK